MKYFDSDILQKEQIYVAVTMLIDGKRKTFIMTTEDIEKACHRLGENVEKLTDRNKARAVRSLQRHLIHSPELVYDEEKNAWGVPEYLLSMLEYEDGQSIQIKRRDNDNKSENWIYDEAIAEIYCVNEEA